MDVLFSDFDSYSDGSNSEDLEDDDEFTYGGQASCILSNLEGTIGKIDDLLSFEREYVHGDVVYLIHDPSGQTGKVMNVEKVVDLESVNGHKLKCISSKKLGKIRSVSIGDYIVAGRWLGKAERIVDRVTVVFDDSTKCEFTTMDDDKIVPLSSDPFGDSDSQSVWFPGQRVKLANSSIFNSTNWFCGSEKDQEHEGTVCAVDAGFVYVNWLVCGPFGLEGTTVPAHFQRSEHLTSLSAFAHTNWQLGDWCLLPGFQETFVISKVKIKLDVLWQDGSESPGLDPGSVGPVNFVDSHDFWPHQFVLEKGTPDDQENKKWGVVKIVDSKEKTVKVKWDGNGIEDTLSAYELIEHPEFSYCHGDVVFGLEESCPIGIVMGCKDGRVEVKWSAGFKSEVAPNEIFLMDKSEAVSGTPLVHNEMIVSGQDKSEHSDPATDPMAKGLVHFDGNGKDRLMSSCDYTTFHFPRVAIGFLYDVAARLFGSKTYTLSSQTSNSLSREQTSGFDCQEENAASVETYKDINIKETDESKDVPFSSSSKKLEKVEQFEMVNDCSTHHFVDRAGTGLNTNQVNRKWLKKVQQEWNILMNDLPETIYVRVYEERMDLLRAAIVGAPGTPYHDGLFFFDIFLPPEYPQEPPMVHYISGGLRVNPNLYESGRVCLSLLNTWTGTGIETWNPKDSTVLQVLLSLQALVLNKNPYFNEAGYEEQVGSVEGEKNSCSYNENVFLLSCKSMIYTLCNPPKHFGALVEEHFSRRCTYILTACNAYMEGVPVGYAFDGENAKTVSQTKSSKGFKIALSKLNPKLVEAFGAKGFGCVARMHMICRLLYKMNLWKDEGVFM